jgi:poly(3-hydroxybutyrate) depolymerase
MLRKLRKLFKVFVIILAVGIIALVALKSYNDRNYFADYDPALPADAKVAAAEVITEPIEVFDIERQREYLRTKFDFEARPGDRVPCLLTQPVQFEGKLPTIVFLHGSGQDKEFIEEICTPFNQAGFAMVSYDQWNCGERRHAKSEFAKAVSWLDRGWKTVNDARRLVDFLVTRPDVDPDRIYLVGASYGAMTGTHVLAKDKRFKAGILVVGGGDFNVMLQAPMIKNNVPALLHAVLTPFLSWYAAPFDPIRSAPATGPTPILMQNGSDDVLVSPDAGRALYAALADPKEIVWYPIDHPGLRDGDGPLVIEMLDAGVVWLADKAGITLNPTEPAPAEAPTAAGEAEAPAAPAV